jgi:hypothetical protein
MIIHRLFEVRYPIFGQAHITSDLCLAANLLWGRSQSEGMPQKQKRIPPRPPHMNVAKYVVPVGQPMCLLLLVISLI